ncbi:inter-alpha-trypsin inhibitor heavy chain H3-like [Grus japonensis]|uniref:Inter-alpha-trypsin inhibitor heavy chain H3 n=1 Tax=Grus japonensis TaxID=30415 RepID=A0ABC9XD41_GRUJA
MLAQNVTHEALGAKRDKKRNADNDLVVNGIEISNMKIDSKITSRFAHNVITSQAVNRGNVHKEVIFDVELPKTAFITNFSMTIDGVTYPGIIKEKEVAKKQYEKAVSKGQTAGLVKASGRKTEKFTVSVNIEAASKVTFELTYEELLKRQFGKYEMFIKVKPKQLVKDFEIEVNIFEPQGITELEAEGTFITNDLQNIIKKTFTEKKGLISFKPTLDQQRTCATCSQSVLDGDFTVRYDVKRTTPDNLQIVNGYFVHFFAPTNLPKLPKNVIFVIDISGSMSGREIEQTRQALLKILDDIKDDDFFNFILFGSEVHTWKEALIKATPENLDEARKFVRSIDTAGMTNLHGGIMRGIDMLNAAHEGNLVLKRSASIIIMLTDGQPNVGISNTQDIQEHVKKAIEGKYPLYNLGFGYGVDYSFLEKMALENKGLARRIYPDSDAALQLQGFYDEVSNPMLTDVELNYPENEISDLTKNSFKHFYDGSEIVVAGRFIDSNQNSLTVDVRGEGAKDALSYTTQQDAEQTAEALKEQEYIFGDYIERLWAYLTIEQLLEKRIAATGEEKENLTAEALDLSLKYKFVTPLTSMVVTKPESYDNQDGIADKPIEVDGDPHFIISVPQKDDAICFNINENPGAVLNLVNDPVTGITVNGELIGDKRANSDAKIQNTYFGKLGIANKHLDLKLTVTPERITLQNGNEKTGQFFHTIDFTILEIHPGSDPKKPDATMIVKNNELRVTRGWQKDYRRDPKHGIDIPCWFVHNNGAGLIDGVHTDYIVSSLF